MDNSRFAVAVIAAFIGFSIFCLSASATDLTGVWATDASACKKIFVKSGSDISFTNDSDFYGGGFIIEGNRIRGKMAACNITSRKEDGAVTNLVAKCSTDLAFGVAQFSLKIDDENKITRLFTGLPELATPYFRCSL
jgi:hypothetical protein